MSKCWVHIEIFWNILNIFWIYFDIFCIFCASTRPFTYCIQFCCFSFWPMPICTMSEHESWSFSTWEFQFWGPDSTHFLLMWEVANPPKQRKTHWFWLGIPRINKLGHTRVSPKCTVPVTLTRAPRGRPWFWAVNFVLYLSRSILVMRMDMAPNRDPHDLG